VQTNRPTAPHPALRATLPFQGRDKKETASQHRLYFWLALRVMHRSLATVMAGLDPAIHDAGRQTPELRTVLPC